MTKNHFGQLTNIFTALQSISTKGEDTLAMAECLMALRNLLIELKETIEE